MVLFRESGRKVCAMRKGDRNTDKCASRCVACCDATYEDELSSED